MANIRQYTHFSLYQLLDAAVSGFFFRKLKKLKKPVAASTGCGRNSEEF